MVQYGSDDVGAIVLDISTTSTRAGYAGEDTPKSIIPTSYGYIPATESDNLPARYYFGHSGPSIWRPNQQVMNPMRDSIVHDWEAAERLIEHSINDGLRLGKLDENPLLTAEASWNSKENRERMTEIAFEGWDTPAYYSVDRAVLSGFASGKGTALIIDIGEDTSSVIPVYDGYVLRKAIQKSPLGGSLLSNMVQGTLQAFANDPSNPFQITPRYLVKSRQVVEPGQAPNCVLNESRLPQTTESYARRAEADLIHDFKETVCAVYEGSFNEQMVLNKPSRNFEFPDGFNMQWNPRIRYYAPELFFQPQVIIPKELTAHAPPTNNSTIPTPPLSMATPIAHMVINSANACDADLLPSLLSNIVVVGGTSLMVGFVERLHNELTAVAPGFKIKITASGSAVERRYAAWLGGSILSSLGTFHQLWISKQEYQEVGKSIVHRRAK